MKEKMSSFSLDINLKCYGKKWIIKEYFYSQHCIIHDSFWITGCLRLLFYSDVNWIWSKLKCNLFHWWISTEPKKHVFNQKKTSCTNNRLGFNSRRTKNVSKQKIFKLSTKQINKKPLNTKRPKFLLSYTGI
jgi:hypothetical protein